MFPARRRKSTSLIEQLLAAPHSFSFQQAVRLLERALVYTPGKAEANQAVYGQVAHGQAFVNQSPYGLIGEFTPPANETLEFFTKPTLAFPENEIARIELSRKSDSGAIRAQANFIGLLGAMGVMPYHYTEFLLQRQKQKDESFAHFLDLFNHRIISLFYRAQTKYSLPLSIERSQLSQSRASESFAPTQALLSLVGMGTQKLNNRLGLSDHSLIYYGGLFVSQVRTASGLKRMLADYFGLRVEVEQFIGQWQELIADIRTRMGDRFNPQGQNARLGHSAMLGSRAWIAQGKIRIVIGPLNKQQLAIFAPGTKTFGVMNQLVQMYLGMEQDYEFIMVINRADLPKRMLMSAKQPPILGWSSWMMGDGSSAGASETVKITVSAKRN